MKKKLTAILLGTFCIAITACEKNNTEKEISLPTHCFEGRLEIQDICGNYTIKVLGGDIDPSLVVSSWQHPTTKVTYQNVFSLGNICQFPTTIKEGDRFYFTIRDTKREPCAQCLAYVPTPDKTLSINVSTTPCFNTDN